jgi:hypothetical protein
MRRRQIPEKLNKNPSLAALMSAVLPGLGQFYNRQIGKGWGFLVGAGFMAVILISGYSTDRPLKSSRESAVWDNQDLFFAVGPFLLGFMIWSAVDAFRTARGPQ